MLHEGLYRLYIWVIFNGLCMVLKGPGVVFSATLGAIQALGVLFNDHWVVLEGPGWCSMVHDLVEWSEPQRLRVLLNATCVISTNNERLKVTSSLSCAIPL